MTPGPGMLAVLRGRHIVGYIAAERVSDFELYVFLEFVPGGSIASMLARFGPFSEDLIRLYTRQMLLGLQYLHDRKIIHRDLKGANVLVTKDGVVKLADFGASKVYSEGTVTDGFKSLAGSLFWMAPEVMKGVSADGRCSDIWSVGCTVIEMYTGAHPWPDMDNGWAAIFSIARNVNGPPLPTNASKEGLDFMQKVFKYEPGERPTAAQLLKHPFVAGRPDPSDPQEDELVTTM
ncbi:hypothetical protein CYMTET_45276 [Cymbomonas tetramitiformis]|uniref:Protein kinase domain-containing protein n=1 Tax=Cymbomonas tetramitiformis TaxID=36881 RepID=A0AAE0EYR3_9CHLO|nr:hypothetical protein CYMTET_45276 [Cymbomonas tetramitiformis]